MTGRLVPAALLFTLAVACAEEGASTQADGAVGDARFP
jgi:hypothetical protein